jgi:hypothetical protein
MSSPLRVPAASLHLTPELAENLRSLSFEGLKSLPRRGAEVGGLIMAAPSSPSIADEVRLVTSEYLFGPSYQLSDKDLLRLHEAAARCRKEGRFIAAYFRSSTRPNDEVDDHDRRVIGDVSPETAFVVIARPESSGGARIRVFRAEDEGRWGVFEELNVPPPHRSRPAPTDDKMQPQDALRTLGRSAPAAPRSPQAADIPGREVRSEQPARQAQGTSSQAYWRTLIAGNPLMAMLILAAVALLGVVIVKTIIGPRQASGDVAPESGVSTQPAVGGTAAESVLGLAVRPETRQLHLTWNRESPAVRSATFGVLQIMDGGTPVLIELATSELTEGSFVYTPHSQDVTFRLRLGKSSGQIAEEMIRVFGATPPAPAAAPPETTEASTPPPERESVKQRPSRPAVSRAAPTVRTNSRPASQQAAHQDSLPRNAATAANSTKAPKQQAARSQSAQPQIAQTQNVQPQTAPPQIAQSQTAPSQKAQSTLPTETARQNSVPVSREPEAIRQPQATSPPGPQSASAATTAVSTAETSLPDKAATPPGASAGSAVSYPSPLRQVQPSLATRWTVGAPTAIAVLVSVDPKGLVTDARPELASKGKSLFLEGLCLNAARQWTFKPATINGKPVAGKYRIEFVFRPN